MPRDGARFPGRGDADTGEVLGGADSMDQVRFLVDIPQGSLVVVGFGGGAGGDVGVGVAGGVGSADGESCRRCWCWCWWC